MEQYEEEPKVTYQLEPHEIEALIKARKEAEAEARAARPTVPQKPEPREAARLAAETKGGNITDYLPAGSYVCPTKGEAKAAYGDYRRIGDPGTFPDA